MAAPRRRARADLGQSLILGGLQALTLSYAGDPAADAAPRGCSTRAGDTCTPHAAFAWYAAGEAVMGDDVALARARLARALELADATGATFVTGVAGTTDVSIEARDGDPPVAAAEYRRLIEPLAAGRHVGDAVDDAAGDRRRCSAASAATATPPSSSAR